MDNESSLKEQLKSENAEVRRVAVEKISEQTNKGSLDLLFEAIGDTDWRVRKTAADALVYFNTLEGFYKRIYEALESADNAGKRNAAVEIVTKIGDKAVGTITNYLPHANSEVKKLLIDALGEIKDAACADSVANFLTDSDENVRSAAAETLGKIKHIASVKYLVRVLKKDDMQLQFCALEALERIGEPVDINYIIPLIDKKILRKAAFEVLGKSSEKAAVKHLLGGLSDSSKTIREAAIKAIVNIYDSISEEQEKQNIIKLLSSVSSEELLDKLTVSLNSSYKNIVNSVITLLGFLKATKTIPKILDVYSSDDELAKCKFNAIVAMGSESYDVMKVEFLSRNDSDRYFLAQIMGELKDERYEKLLVDSLNDNFGHLRSAASLALSKLGKAESINQIFPRLNDQYRDVQLAALEALTTLGNLYPKEIRKEIEDNLIANDDKFKISIISLIGRIGIKEDIKHLDMALRFGNPDVRTAAVYAIGTINILDESKHLIMALTDESDKVRIATSKILGLLYSEESVKALIRALGDSNTWVQINSMRSLAQLNASKAIEHITKFLKHENPLLVINAIESLKEMNVPGLKGYLRELLHHKDTEIVKVVINILKESLDEETINDILELLNSDAPDFRILIYKSLGNIKNDEIIKKVMPFIEKESDDMVKRMAKRMLGISS
jgi:HEAT repeat protein